MVHREHTCRGKFTAAAHPVEMVALQSFEVEIEAAGKQQ
jgi:hypothetical protein